jgi:hypothetical protein
MTIAGCTSSSWYTHSSTSELCTLPSRNSVCKRVATGNGSPVCVRWPIRREAAGLLVAAGWLLVCS